jgi:hypothetical protein
VTCVAYFTVADVPHSVVQTLSGPNGQSYTFHYDSTYGLVNEIDYPGGGWVKYTWKLSDTLSTLATFAGLQSGQPPVSGACNYEYQTPVIATRTVGYSANSAAAQTQTFQYSTTWNGAGQWFSKTTTVSTLDNVTGKQAQTVYTYGAVGQPVQPNEGGELQGQVPVETSIQYFDWNNTVTPLMTVKKTWADQFKMTSEQTALGSGLSSDSSSTVCGEDWP